MQIPAEVLKILVCPESRLPLVPAEQQLVDALNAQISRGTLANRGGAAVADPMDSVLLRSDRKVCYPVRNDIPSLLIEEGIVLES